MRASFLCIIQDSAVSEWFERKERAGAVPTWPDVSPADTDPRQGRSVLRIDGKVDDSCHRVDEEQALEQVGYGVGCLCAAEDGFRV